MKLSSSAEFHLVTSPDTGLACSSHFLISNNLTVKWKTLLTRTGHNFYKAVTVWHVPADLFGCGPLKELGK